MGMGRGRQPKYRMTPKAARGPSRDSEQSASSEAGESDQPSAPQTALAVRQEQLLFELDPASQRAATIRAVQDFRGSWVELGRLLTDVAYGGDYKEWGYDDFEVYCARELGIKKPTVKKLMLSFNYLKKHKVELLEQVDRGETAAFLPEYQTVAELQGVEQRGNVDPDKLREVTVEVFSGETDQREVRKRLAEISAEPVLPGMERRKTIQKIQDHCRQLRKLAKLPGFAPNNLVLSLENVLVEFERLA